MSEALEKITREGIAKNEENLEGQRPGGVNPAMTYLARFGSAHSRRALRSSLDIISRLLSRNTLDALSFNWPELRYEHLGAVRSRLQQDGKAPATINRHLHAARGVLKECWRLGLISGEDYRRATDIEPVRGTRLPAGRSLLQRELRALFETCAEAGPETGARNAAILALLYAGGLRRSEVVALNLKDWNSEGAVLRVRGKGNRERLVHLNDGALDALNAWLEARRKDTPAALDGDAPIFVAINKGGAVSSNRISSQAVFDMVVAVGKEAGIAHLSPHDLRRSFISDLLDAGADITTVQKMAGHSNIQTTAKYDRRGETAKARAAQLLRVPFVKATEPG